MNKVTKTVKIDFKEYEELLQAKIQRDMLLNIAQNASKYNVSEHIRAAFNLDVTEPEDLKMSWNVR